MYVVMLCDFDPCRLGEERRAGMLGVRGGVANDRTLPAHESRRKVEDVMDYRT